MAVYTSDIYAAAQAMGGPASTALSDLCAVSEDALTARLKGGVTASDCETVLKQASAMMALSLFYMTEAAGPVSGYSAGTVSVTEKSGAAAAEGAEGLRKQAEALMAPYILDGSFVFTGVRG